LPEINADSLDLFLLEDTVWIACAETGISSYDFPMEDLCGIGLTAADLAAGGRAADQWDELSKGLLDRAVKGMKIRR